MSSYDSFQLTTHVSHRTATTITMTLDILGRHDDVQQKLYEEVSEVIGDTAPDEVTLDQIKRMAYLEAVIKETLRVFGPLALIARRLYQDLKVKDYVIPRGTDVWMVLRAMQTSDTYFENASQFKPERFMGNTISLVLNFPTKS